MQNNIQNRQQLYGVAVASAVPFVGLGFIFWKSQFLRKSVNLSFTITNVKHKLTYSCGS